MRKLSIAALIATLFSAPVLAADDGYIPWTWDDEVEENDNRADEDTGRDR